MKAIFNTNKWFWTTVMTSKLIDLIFIYQLFYIIIKHFKIIWIIIFFFISFFSFSAESCNLISVIFSLSMSRYHIFWYFMGAFSFAGFKTVLRILLNSNSMVFSSWLTTRRNFIFFWWFNFLYLSMIVFIRVAKFLFHELNIIFCFFQH